MYVKYFVALIYYIVSLLGFVCEFGGEGGKSLKKRERKK